MRNVSNIKQKKLLQHLIAKKIMECLRYNFPVFTLLLFFALYFYLFQMSLSNYFKFMFLGTISDLPVTEQFREEDFFKKEDEEFTLENSALENSSDASDFEKG